MNQNSKLKINNSRSGQSLLEILIGLGIGGVLIGAASIGIAFMLRSSLASQNYQKGSAFAASLSDKVTSWASANWQNIYGLNKGTAAQYFLNASGTGFFAVPGQEGVVDGDIVSGLIGHWGLDEASGGNVYDESGNNYNGSSAALYRVTSGCPIGDCVNALSTSQAITVTNSNFSALHSNVTLTHWVRVDNTIPASNWPYSAAGNTYTSYGFRSASNGTGWYFEYATDYPTCGGSAFTNLGADTLGLNTWHFLAMTYDGSVIREYLDGNQVHQVNFTAGFCGFSTFYIAYPPTAPGSFDVDDVRLYNRALSASEISALYHAMPFSRYFTVQDVCRSNDTSSSIIGVAPCGSGAILDPSTEQVSVYTNWLPNTSGSPQIQLTNYLTRWQNQAFTQADWSGGAGNDGPFTAPGRFYSTSTNIDATSNPGSIKILNLSP